MPPHEAGAIIHPRMFGWQDITSDGIGLLHRAATLPTSQEVLGSNPMLDEWVKLARALVAVITQM